MERIRGRRTLKAARSGHLQKPLALATAATSLPLGFEIYLEHYRGSYANKWMWAPIVASPILAATAVAALRSETVAKTLLPAASAAYAAQGLIGGYLHIRGIKRRPGGFDETLYNMVMGPPVLAPGSLAAIGALGMAAPFFPRD